MIKFDLCRALRGDALISREGESVTHFRKRGSCKIYPYKADSSLSQHFATYTAIGGYTSDGNESKHDLFMKYEEEKKTMKKSDLKTGMFVKYRNGEYRMVLGDFITSEQGSGILRNYSDNLKLNNYPSLDIDSIYEAKSCNTLDKLLEGKDLTLLWERKEQTEAQKEMQALNKQITALQEQAKLLESKL
jgi:hypothetical protein